MISHTRCICYVSRNGKFVPAFFMGGDTSANSGSTALRVAYNVNRAGKGYINILTKSADKSSTVCQNA